jgi:hypothetical protein
MKKMALLLEIPEAYLQMYFKEIPDGFWVYCMNHPKEAYELMEKVAKESQGEII